jgi:hypothetical protein
LYPESLLSSPFLLTIVVILPEVRSGSIESGTCIGIWGHQKRRLKTIIIRQKTPGLECLIMWSYFIKAAFKTRGYQVETEIMESRIVGIIYRNVP